VLNGRLYRASFAPLLVALAVAGFSLTAPRGSLSSTLAPDAFNGSAAFAELQGLAKRFPERRPGSRGDRALAAEVARTLESLGSSAAGGFSVSTRSFTAATLDGPRTLTTVVARRPGLTGASPIVLLAHRDGLAGGGGARAGDAEAELSGTAVLLQLARVLATSETHRTIVVVSTSGGSSGNAGAADFAAHAGGPLDAAIVLGDVAGAQARKPFVLSYSDGLGSAPALLVRTLSGAISQDVGVDPGTSPDTLSAFAHLALPLTPGEEGPLLAHGLPAVALQVSGERGPAPGDPVSAARLENFGRAALSGVYALDAGPDLPAALETGLPIQRKTLPEWAVRLLLLALLLPPLVVLLDGLARLRRRRIGMVEGTGSRGPHSPPGWLGSLRNPAGEKTLRPAFVWALACALPFLIAALFTRALGLLGILAAPAGLVLPGALPSGAVAFESVLAPLLVLALAWLAWPALMRRLKLPAFGLRAAGATDAAGIALMLVLLVVTLVLWLFNPYAALLPIPALHLWLAVIDPDWRTAGPALHRVRALALIALGLLPLVLLVALYAHELGYGLGGLAHAAVLLLAGGYLGIPAILIWCLAFGCLSAATLVALSPAPPLLSGADAELPQGAPITVRGPMSYAGPGSLGGTESALRR
jgi:hypothetical protein